MSNFSFGVTHLIPTDKQPASNWWDAYSAALTADGLSPTSIKVIDSDSAFILDEGIFGDGAPGTDGWPASRQRSGLVMGSVQSGKTASMLAVVAKALDAGLDAVVVLAGTRTGLWQQTLERLQVQLDVLPQPWTRRVLLPNGAVSPSTDSSADLSTLYSVTGPLAKRAVLTHRPLLAVVMKNVFHLERLTATLHKYFYPVAEQRDGPFHLLVIDDEADDSSILDAVNEARTGVSLADTKQVPRRIADLWESRTSRGETGHPNLFVTYIAYTATPQANLLQDASNSLAPRDFAISLRTAAQTGSLSPRSMTYADPAGLRAWYTGGDMFYRRLAAVPLCRTTESPDEAFASAIRSYLVACAVRLWRSPGKLGPATANGRVFASREEARQKTAGVSSMLIHPSSVKDDHFDVAARVLAWGHNVNESEGRSMLNAGRRRLSSVAIASRMDSEPEAWTYWISEFADAADKIFVELSLPCKSAVPSLADWSEIRSLILEEVVPGTTLAVINSDESADERPDFWPRRMAEGWSAPLNHSTIFVSGNVMARGLTLEGLTTTLFTRRSESPLADTQMQMQRWFGYRGSVVELCRVFMAPAQLELFSAYNETDEALRADIFAVMSGADGPAAAMSVLQGHQFSATGKIANLASQSVWPGVSPFVRHMNAPEEDIANDDLVASVLGRGFDVVRTRGGSDLGLLLQEDLSLNEAADLLDSLSYSDFGPGTARFSAHRWASLSHHLGLRPTDVEFPLYRAPYIEGGINLDTGSPYDIAAYLRTWAAALSRRASGLVTTDPPFGPWGLVDLKARAAARPVFRVGLRFGRGHTVTLGPLSRLGQAVTTMERSLTPDGHLRGGWGARGAAGVGFDEDKSDDRYPGDQNFDYFGRGETAPERALGSAGRGPGEPGLILFHPVARSDTTHSIAVGLALPQGGPDQIVALASGGTTDA